ncbi:MAG: hypothetical protein KA876_03905, partial [Prevotella sp.]|nr:hypothetical protein [Prevotella sp.]
MERLDNSFTEKLQNWLESEHTEDNIREGALLLLQIDKNRNLYQNLIRKPKMFLPKLEHELRKHLTYRLDKFTRSEVRKMDAEITPVMDASITAVADTDNIPALLDDTVELRPTAIIAKGMREDHAELAPEIQKIWTENAARWKKIKSLYETCKSLTQSCDKYESLKSIGEEFPSMIQDLRDNYYTYKKEMQKYDDAQKVTDTPVVEQTENAAVTLAKSIGNARSYISKAVPQVKYLTELADEKSLASAEALKSKIAERAKLLADNQSMTEDMIASLAEINVT